MLLLKTGGSLWQFGIFFRQGVVNRAKAFLNQQRLPFTRGHYAGKQDTCLFEKENFKFFVRHRRLCGQRGFF